MSQAQNRVETAGGARLSSASLAARARWAAYAGSIGLFLWLALRFYLPGMGFTALIMFSAKSSAHYLPEVKAARFHEQSDYGYDAQYYAQIAVDPRLRDPALLQAVDTLPYRSRRILFCWTAHVLGFGRTSWVLNVFALQNVVAWLLLSWVLLRWFPPTCWENFVRWFSVLFTSGLCFSVRASLMDGPSLLLIAIGMALVEADRHGWAIAVLGAAGLGKETNTLAVVSLLPTEVRDWRGWLVAVAKGIAVVLPLASWLMWIQYALGHADDAGARNFAAPFVGWFHKAEHTFQMLFGSNGRAVGLAEACALAALTVQWLYFALRPRFRDAWWRVGSVYAALMMLLGDAVWEGYPGAAGRVLLPMTLAFNVTLPRGRRWWTVLLLGNLLIWPSVDIFVPPAWQDSEVQGTHSLKVDDATGRQVEVEFASRQWYGPESSRFDYWHWAHGPAMLTIHNPHPFPIRANIRFDLKSSDERRVTVAVGGRVIWRGRTDKVMHPVRMSGFTLAPGNSTLSFTCDRPAVHLVSGDTRIYSFRICNLVVSLTDAVRPAAGR